MQRWGVRTPLLLIQLMFSLYPIRFSIPIALMWCDPSPLSPFVYQPFLRYIFIPTRNPIICRPTPVHRICCCMPDTRKKKMDNVIWEIRWVWFFPAAATAASTIVHHGILYTVCNSSINGHTYLHLQTNTTCRVALREKTDSKKKKQ